LFGRIQKTVRELVGTQYALWKNELLPELAKNGIYVREIAELSGTDRFQKNRTCDLLGLVFEHGQQW